jgi:tetratricopeptide (TPR) repeat protein
LGERAGPALAFVTAGGILVLYALRGGSYDIVVRQEMGLGIWWVLGLGFALGLLPRSRVPRSRLLGVAAMVCLGIWVAIGFAWTESDERTMAELGRIVAFAGLLLLPLVLIRPGTWRAAAGGLVAAALGICALAVASRLLPGSFPNDPVQASFLSERLNYPFHYWNAVGAWGAMSIAMGLAWSAHARLLVTRMLALAAVPIAGVAVYLTYSRAGIVGTAVGVGVVLALSRNRWVVAAHTISAALGVTASILAVRGAPQIAHATGSAGAGRVLVVILLAAVLGGGTAGATWVLRGGDRWRMAPRSGRALLAALLVALAVAGAVAGPSLARQAWHDFSKDPFKAQSRQGADPATRLSTLSGNRRNLWASALSAFAAHPAGTGAGTFEFWWEREARNPEFVRDAHSLYFESLAELGWPGLAILLATLGSLLWLGFAGRRRIHSAPAVGAWAALIAAFVVFLVAAGVDWMWESTAVAALGLGAIATAGAVPRQDDDERAGSRSTASDLSRRLPIPWRVAAATVALVACLIELPALVSTSEVRRSQASIRVGALDRAYRQANDAVAAEPWAATPYVQRGVVEESEGRFRAARTDLTRAIAREPTNWRHPLVLARIEAELGDSRAAIRSYERARRLHPTSRLFASP